MNKRLMWLSFYSHISREATIDMQKNREPNIKMELYLYPIMTG